MAGGIELGRAAAPVSLLDEATLGAPLCVEGRARHARGAQSLAVPLRGGGLGLGPPSSEARPEPTLDGAGTVRVEVDAIGQLEPVAAAACWRAWNAATLGYLAGLAERALELAVEHARARRTVRRTARGAPRRPVPARGCRARDGRHHASRLGCRLERRRAPGAGAALRGSAPAATSSPRRTQVHGAVGFALETGLHVYHRRARSVHAWATAACDAAR